MIEVRELTKSFPAGSGEVKAVDRVTFTIRAGEFILIYGRSGSGKSTMLGMLAGLINPTSGTVRIQGVDIGTLKDDAISALRASEIGFVFQFSGLIPTLTVRENVLVPTLFCRKTGASSGYALDLITRTGLLDRIDAYPGTLSSGEMKRTAIARALVNRPSLIIADEPTGDLDADTEREIMELFSELNRDGHTIVMVTHNPELVSYGTRTYRMEKGSLVEQTGSDR